MSKKNWEPEANTYADGTTKRDLSDVTCCVPVRFAWAMQREGNLVVVGYRHTGYTCAGQFTEMPFRRWQRAHFRPDFHPKHEKKARR